MASTIGFRHISKPLRTRALARSAVWLGVSVLLGCGAQQRSPGGDGSSEGSTRTGPEADAIVRAFPEPAGAHVTWWVDGEAAPLRLDWQDSSGGQRGSVDVSGRTSWSIDGLVDGEAITVELSSGDSPLGLPASVTPRPRPGCSFVDYQPALPGVSLFCTKQAIDDHLRETGTSPDTLRCRGRRVEVWDRHAADCVYTVGGRQLILSRAVDDVPDLQEPLAPDLVRRAGRDLIWGESDPWVAPDRYPELVAAPGGDPDAVEYEVDLGDGLFSVITRVAPPSLVAGRYAIFHEGHDASALTPTSPDELLPKGGRDMIDRLLANGFTVYALDMPLEGRNATESGPLRTHTDLVSLDSGGTSPVGRLLLPAKLVIDRIEADAAAEGVDDPLILMMGRSGGGWTTNMVASLDDRVDVAVSVAGGLPQSQHLLDPMGPWEIGDYEQYVPHIYDIVGNENLIAAAGRSASFLSYSPIDLCCHRLGPDTPFVEWLGRWSDEFTKPITVSIDVGNRRHGPSATQFAQLDAFLAQLPTSPP